jgi:hypothetical protein
LLSTGVNGPVILISSVVSDYQDKYKRFLDNVEMGRWVNGKMGKWGNGKMGRWEDVIAIVTRC